MQKWTPGKTGLKSFEFFFNYLRYRIFLSVFLSLFVAIFDAFGLVMLLPLFQLAKGSSLVPGNGTGKLSIPVLALMKLGIAYNLVNVMIIIILLFLLKGILKFYDTYYTGYLQLLLVRKLRVGAINKLCAYNYKSFSNSNTGHSQNLGEEINRVTLSSQHFFNVLSNGAMILACLVFALFANFQFSVFIIFGSLITNLGYQVLFKKTKAYAVVYTKRAHDFQALLLQQVFHFKYLKATNLMNLYTQKVKASNLIMEKTSMKMSFYNAWVAAVREPLSVFLIMSILFVELTFFKQPFASLFLSLLLFIRVIAYIMQLQGGWNSFLQLYGSVDNYQSFIAELDEGRESSGKISFVGFKNKIILNSIHFFYGDIPIINGLNLEICKNETIALVGKSGSGKTTLVNIITGLLPLDKGELLIDGVPIADLDIMTYRDRIGYITQDPVIFNDTLYNNITCWADKSPDNLKKYLAVLSQSGLNDYEQRLTLREDTMLSTSGLNLSGGEKQRIAIARELFKAIDILVIDEGTSSLDVETANVINESIAKLKGMLTIIIIAHNFRTIKNADSVILLKHGEIENKGSFEFLKANSATFKRMIHLQNL
jgi:ABC-type multidrug transport system fused ATPase/permease subunit